MALYELGMSFLKGWGVTKDKVIAFHYFKPVDVECLIAVKGGIHGIGIDAKGFMSFCRHVLRQHRGDQGLAHTSLAL